MSFTTIDVAHGGPLARITLNPLMGALLRLWRRQVPDLLASTGRLHLRLTVLNARLSYPRDDPRLVVGRELRQRVAFPVYLLSAVMRSSP